jgi:membrane protein
VRRWLRRAGRLVATLARAQHQDRLVLWAAALAYTTLLSLVPVFTLLLVMAARLEPERAEALLYTLASLLPFSPAAIQETLAEFAQRTAALGWVAVVVSTIAAVNLVYQVEQVMNQVWRVPSRRKWRWRIVSFVTIVVSGPVLLTALLSWLYWVSSRPWYPMVAPLGRPLPALIAAAVLTAVFRVGPHTHVSWRAAAAGAAVATGALVVLYYSFQFYVDFASGLNVIYGSLTVGLFFLISLVLFWLAILLGVEASWAVGHPPYPATRRQAERVLALLSEVSRFGRVDEARVVRVLGKGGDVHFERLLEEPPLLERTPDGYRLAREAQSISLAEVLRRIAPGRPTPARPRRGPGRAAGPGDGTATPGASPPDAAGAPASPTPAEPGPAPPLPPEDGTAGS